jgi:hypothetical protein
MTNEQHKNQPDSKQQALTALNNLLSIVNARDLRNNMQEIFYGFLNSENADSQSFRNRLGATHLYLIEFLTKIADLPEIDRFDRN